MYGKREVELIVERLWSDFFVPLFVVMKRGKEGETSLCLTPRAYDAHYASMSTTNAYAYTLMSTHNNRTHALTSVTNPRDSNCFMHSLSALTA